jgi:hypothetical protein
MIAHSPVKSRPKAFFSSGALFAAAAFAIGLLVAFILFPTDMLLNRWSWWGRISGDNAASMIGYLYFAQDEWRWPLYYTLLLDPPSGANIIYTDPVPLAALLGKLIFKVTGTMPVYMGTWILLSYGLQSLMAWLIFRQIGLKRGAALFAAVVILLTPAFIFRFVHIGLVAHFVILAAILFYLRAVSVARKPEMALSAAAIGGILFVNPYLLAMSATIFLAGLGEAALRGRISWTFGAVFAAVMTAVVGAVAYIFGIVGQEGVPSVGGFGNYSMNLLSPITPQFSSIAGQESYLLDKTGGQYEGFNYLGAGVLLLIASAFLLSTRMIGGQLNRHRILMLALVGLTLYAVSSKVYFGSRLVADLRYDDWPILNTLTSIFRSSGRFFWPVGYLLVIGAIAILARKVAQWAFVPLITVAILAQLWDIRPLLNHAWASSLPYAELIDRAKWARAMAAHDEVTIYPDYYCIDRQHHALVTQLQLTAALSRIPVNAAYINRKYSNCSGSVLKGRLDSVSVTSNPLVVVFKNRMPVQLLKSDVAEEFACRDADFAFVCSRQSNAPAFVALGTEFHAPAIPLGAQLAVGEGGRGASFLEAGWSDPEGGRRWAQGRVTSIMGKLDQPVCQSLSFKALVYPLSKGAYMPRRAKVILNGEAAGQIVLQTPDEQVISHTIPLGGRCTEEVRLELQFEALRAPKDLGINDDPRRLSWMFVWFSLAEGKADGSALQ